MYKNIAIITIHGMGKTGPDYYKSLERKLTKYVGKDLWNKEVHLESVYYQDLLQGNQENYWNSIDDEYSLRWDFLRKFMLFSFSDAASIEHSLRNDLKLYKAVHQKIATAFDNSFVELGNKSKPVIVIARSLGCEQISNYIWDAMNCKRLFCSHKPKKTKHQESEQLKFRKLSTCYKLITTGCNIPLFRAGLDNPELFKRPNINFCWDNYFDVDDVLAFPIKEISDSFNTDWINDKKISVGGFLTGWNPACHSKYWTDKDVVKSIADEIKKILRQKQSFMGNG